MSPHTKFLSILEWFWTGLVECRWLEMTLALQFGLQCSGGAPGAISALVGLCIDCLSPLPPWTVHFHPINACEYQQSFVRCATMGDN